MINPIQSKKNKNKENKQQKQKGYKKARFLVTSYFYIKSNFN